VIVATILTNGRIDLLDRTIESFNDKLRAGENVTRRILWDDSGSDEVYHYLRLAYGPQGWLVTRSPEGASGFGGAMAAAWAWLKGRTNEKYVMWIEDDFVFEKVIQVDAMTSVLEAHPHIAQMALKRQPWNAAEEAAGDVVALNHDAYTQHSERGYQWLEHRLFWTTNPSIFRRDLLTVGWPHVPESEGTFTHRLLGEGLPSGVPGHEVRFGYWGVRTSTPAVTHIGLERTGFGY
jgi:hypothetical protein